MRRAHAWSGILWLLVFLGTGAYMRYYHSPPVDQLADVTRAIYRARHLFILGGALANLALAASESTPPVASALVLVAPPFLFAAFLTDPEQGIHASAPWLSLGQYALFGAAVLLAGRHIRGLRR
jgi:peptidoglycan/LPS O-acetylase OafA/YrhL